MKKQGLLLVFFLYWALLFSQTKLPSFFGNDMVLQQNEKVSIWGLDKPNTKIKIIGSWGEKSSTETNSNGKWQVKLQTPKAGGPFNLEIKGSQKIILKNVLIGEVWLCSGQSNMEMPLKGFINQPIIGSLETLVNSKNNQLRLFHVNKNASLIPLDDVSGSWQEASPETVNNFSATAYYYGKNIQSVLGVPVGLIHTSWGSSTAEAWTDKETISQFESAVIPKEIPKKKKQLVPTLLYNAMLHPFIGYNMKGVIWYQGESNRIRASEYEKLISAMVTSWRIKWKQDFPFYFVQIAPFEYKNTNSAFLREAQLKTMSSLKNSGMAVTMDIGECQNIHPANKKLVGDRLAYWALSNTYNIVEIPYSGPVYKQMTIKDSKVILKFDYADNGFSSFGKKLQGFKIAGKDKVFYEANVNLTKYKKIITVWSDNVPYPVAVRYAFDNCIEGTLYNTEGLPASSFRTDNWDE